MPRFYSKDIQKKVVIYVEKRNSFEKVSTKFEKALNTVSDWYKKYQSKENYLEKKIGGKKRVNSNTNFILSKTGEYFSISAFEALCWLRKLGYRCKKKPIHIWKQIKKV
ncbi:hypothetical protein [Holospora curviuscula]|uniref:Transposase n=1 Tax=Holospora curviuscula TaxID=1082868 RepID=A0A2S5R875_9PROT|nr:hypothetical protein [Holospora curviuscula]PPE03493.1 Transposase [Holospora curviuscula]